MKFIEYTVSERIGSITLNRPEKRNALSFELVDELKQVLTTAEKDERVKIILLKAHGDVFCSGADLTYLQQLQNFSHAENLNDSNHLKDLLYQIYTLNKIVIAQIEGHALAGGCGLATVCDFSFATPEAKFGYPEVKIGFIPAIVMIFLLRKIGEGKSKQLLLGGELITSSEAASFGLINKVMEKDKIRDEVVAFAKKLIFTNSASAMQLTKKMIAEVQSLHIKQALSFAAEMNAKARASEDCKRGIQAFLNKEEIDW